jgi:hypothetical protein
LGNAKPRGLIGWVPGSVGHFLRFTRAFSVFVVLVHGKITQQNRRRSATSQLYNLA